MRRARSSSGEGAGALAIAGLLAVAGCTAEVPDGGPEAVEVTGEFGQRPTVTFDVPLAVRESSVTTVIDGQGAELDDGDPVLVDWIALDGSTGEVIAESYTEAPEVFAFTRESIGEDLYAAVSVSGVNDRVLYLEPATGRSGLPASNVVVVDVRPARAQGEPVEPQGGLPTVQLGEDGAPTVTFAGDAPPAGRVEQVLIKGSGAQVGAESELIVQYHVVRWSDGGVEATTWGEDRLPERLDVSSTFPGLSAGLLDQTAGSQVMLIVPPAEALGTDTLVFVVDILVVVESGAEPSPTEPATPEPGTTPEPGSTSSPSPGPSA